MQGISAQSVFTSWLTQVCNLRSQHDRRRMLDKILVDADFELMRTAKMEGWPSLHKKLTVLTICQERDAYIKANPYIVMTPKISSAKPVYRFCDVDIAQLALQTNFVIPSSICLPCLQRSAINDVVMTVDMPSDELVWGDQAVLDVMEELFERNWTRDTIKGCGRREFLTNMNLLLGGKLVITKNSDIWKTFVKKIFPHCLHNKRLPCLFVRDASTIVKSS